jgi:hypothetical protein
MKREKEREEDSEIKRKAYRRIEVKETTLLKRDKDKE